MPELGFQYELTRSDRRTLSIKISRDAKVLVYAPRRMSLKHIEDFLFEKRAWVLKNLAKVQERKDISDSFVPGGESGLLLLGREYPLIKKSGNAQVLTAATFLFPTGSRLMIRRQRSRKSTARSPKTISSAGHMSLPISSAKRSLRSR